MPEEAKPAGQPSGPDDDLLLVAQILSGDTLAFEQLVRRHERRVFRAALALTGNQDDAEEAMQETFINAYKHLGEFRRESRFSTWLTRIAVNEGLQILRRRKNTLSLDDPGLPEEPPPPRNTEKWHEDPERLYARQEMRQLVEDAISRLAPSYRVVFVMRDIEGMSAAEAAAALGLSIPATKSRLLRARLMVREDLAARLGPRPGLRSRLVHAGLAIRGAVRSGFHWGGEKGER